MHPTLDDIDFQILKILQEDNSLPIKDIAAQVGLSATPTYERIKSMVHSKIIRKHVAILDRNLIGFHLMAYCNITLREQSKKALTDFEKTITKFPEVMEVISLSGSYDYMLKIVSRDIASYNEFIVNTLSNIKNIGQYHSNIVMSLPKQTTAFPI